MSSHVDVEFSVIIGKLKTSPGSVAWLQYCRDILGHEPPEGQHPLEFLKSIPELSDSMISPTLLKWLTTSPYAKNPNVVSLLLYFNGQQSSIAQCITSQTSPHVRFKSSDLMRLTSILKSHPSSKHREILAHCGIFEEKLSATDVAKGIIDKDISPSQLREILLTMDLVKSAQEIETFSGE